MIPDRVLRWAREQPKCRFGEPLPSRLFLLFLVLYHRGRWDDNLQQGWVVYREAQGWESRPMLPRAWRALMCLKAIVCILLAREGVTELRNEHFELGHWGSDTYQTQEGTFHEWAWLAVGAGFLRGWYFEIANEST